MDITEEEIKGMAKDFATRNPRFMEYNVRFLSAAVKANYGKELSVTQLQSFIKHLTGTFVQVSIIEDALMVK